MGGIKIGFLHPGAMGVSLAATAIKSGNVACWVSEGRSSETHKRAEEHRLMEYRSLQELCDSCSIIISVCPPHAAVSVAESVLSCSFRGTYADVNAISPDGARKIGALMESAGVDFVDGGIIGGPAWRQDSTWLYLSGVDSEEIARCFDAGPLETEIIGPEIGKASALKMCFAANTKGTTALLCAVTATAENLGVREVLERHWSRGGSSYAADTFARVAGVTAKAWRFSGEMEEIAATFASAGLPDGFHRAARDVYDRITGFKGCDTPPLEEVLHALSVGARTDYAATWYHGSPLKIDVLLAGSTISQDRDLARVFSHRPEIVSQSKYPIGKTVVRHTGRAPGFLYRISGEVLPDDIYPHPRTTMEPGTEWLTRKDLRLELVEATVPDPEELLSKDEIAELKRKTSMEEPT